MSRLQGPARLLVFGCNSRPDRDSARGDRRRELFWCSVMTENLDLARRYRSHAREARAVASGTRSPKDRDSLLNLADEYERMARELEAEDATAKILNRS